MDNRQWLINGNPKGRPLEASDFKLETSSLGSLAADSARVRVEYLSFDPSQKGQMEKNLNPGKPIKIANCAIW